MSVTFRPMTEADAAPVSALAETIWRAHYTFLPDGQIDHMLAQGYTVESLKQQLTKGQQITLACEGDRILGYLGIVPREKAGQYFLAKFYIDQAEQGKGIGKALFAHMLKSLPDMQRLDLRVNRQNIQAINFYFSLGFRIHSADDLDIGDGFVMNDFVMVWKPRVATTIASHAAAAG